MSFFFASIPTFYKPLSTAYLRWNLWLSLVINLLGAYWLIIKLGDLGHEWEALIVLDKTKKKEINFIGVFFEIICGSEKLEWSREGYSA